MGTVQQLEEKVLKDYDDFYASEMTHINNDPKKMSCEVDVLQLANTLKDCFEESENYFDEEAEDVTIETLLQGANLINALAYCYNNSSYDLNTKDPDDVARFFKGNCYNMIEAQLESGEVKDMYVPSGNNSIQVQAPVYDENAAIAFISQVVKEYCTEDGYYEMYPGDYHDLLSSETLEALTQRYQEEKAEDPTLKLEFVISDYLQDEYGGEGLDAMGQDEMYRHIKEAVAKEPPIMRYHVDSYLEDPDMSLFEKLEQCGYDGVSFDVKDYIPRDYPIKLEEPDKTNKSVSMEM